MQLHSSDSDRIAKGLSDSDSDSDLENMIRIGLYEAVGSDA